MAGKKAANHAGSITKKVETKNGKQYESWRCRYSLPDGTRKEKKFSSQAAAQEFLTQTLADIQNGEYLEPATISVAQWFETWLSEYGSGWKYQTLKSYRSNYETHIKPALGKGKLSSLNTVQIQKFINQLGKTGKKSYRLNKVTGEKELVSSSPLSPKSIKNVHGTLSKALSTAVDVGFLKNNPAEKVTLPRVEKPEMHPLDSTQLSEYLAACTNDDYRFYFQIMPLTGMREAEATALTWDCVDFRKGTLTINKQLIRKSVAEGGYTIDSPKNHKTRIIKPAPFVMTLLEARQKEQEMHKQDAADLWNQFQDSDGKPVNLVFTTKTGSPLNPLTLLKHAKKIFASIGMEESVIHDLRHSFAVLGIQSGDDIKTLSENLGHSTVSFTLDRYGHLTDKMRDESSKRMQALLDAL